MTPARTMTATSPAKHHSLQKDIPLTSGAEASINQVRAWDEPARGSSRLAEPDAPSKHPFVAITRFHERFQDSLNLVLPARLECHVNQSVAQTDAIIGPVELEFDDIGVMARNNLCELVQGSGAIGQVDLEANQPTV